MFVLNKFIIISLQKNERFDLKLGHLQCMYIVNINKLLKLFDMYNIYDIYV